MRLDVRNTKPLVLIFVRAASVKKSTFDLTKKAENWLWRADFERLFQICNQTHKKMPKIGAPKPVFSFFSPNKKIEFLTDTVQTKNRDKQFRIPYIEAHPTHSSERKNLPTFEPVSENNENRLFWETSLDSKL